MTVHFLRQCLALVRPQPVVVEVRSVENAPVSQQPVALAEQGSSVRDVQDGKPGHDGAVGPGLKRGVRGRCMWGKGGSCSSTVPTPQVVRM